MNRDQAMAYTSVPCLCVLVAMVARQPLVTFTITCLSDCNKMQIGTVIPLEKPTVLPVLTAKPRRIGNAGRDTSSRRDSRTGSVRATTAGGPSWRPTSDEVAGNAVSSISFTFSAANRVVKRQSARVTLTTAATEGC